MNKFAVCGWKLDAVLVQTGKYFIVSKSQPSEDSPSPAPQSYTGRGRIRDVRAERSQLRVVYGTFVQNVHNSKGFVYVRIWDVRTERSQLQIHIIWIRPSIFEALWVRIWDVRAERSHHVYGFVYGTFVQNVHNSKSILYG
jgi:hypothetical protein